MRILRSDYVQTFFLMNYFSVNDSIAHLAAAAMSNKALEVS